MTLNIKTCIAWREHVILSCPSADEAEDMGETLDTAEVTAADLKEKTASWMQALTRSLADFIDEDEMDALMSRMIRFFYLEAMNAGQTFHQSTSSLLDRPSGSREKQTAMCAAMVAASFRAVFEEVCREGVSSLSEVWKVHCDNKPDLPIKIDAADTASPATTEG
jgi:hypothetical protein